MNLLSLLIAPVQAVVLFFAPHAAAGKPNGVRMPARAHASTSAQTMQHAHAAPTAHANAAHPRTTHPRTTHPRSKTYVSAKPIHRVRVVRNVDASLPADRAGRMVVSGRFADVCAELDKLASMEMRAA
jgi:hypothetical protein